MRLSSGTGSSRIECLDPPAVTISHIDVSLVKTIRPRLPELNPFGMDPEARPETGARDVAPGELLLVFGDAVVECRRRFEGLALTRRPGPDLAETLAGGEVGIGLLICNFRYRPLDSHLNVDWRPVEAERRLGIGEQLAAFTPLVVRVKHEALIVESLEQDYAH